jgi:hypothetical protein
MFGNSKECSSIGQVLSLLPKNHQFESYKIQGHWRFICTVQNFTNMMMYHLLGLDFEQKL